MVLIILDDFQNLTMWEQVIDMPEILLFLSQMSIYPSFQTIQSAAGVDVISFWKIAFDFFTDLNPGISV